MQQAARVSQRTAFFLLGDLIELGETEDIFTAPQDRADTILYYRTYRLRLDMAMETEHIVKGYDEELKNLDYMIAEMGGLVEAQLHAAVGALLKFDRAKAEDVVKLDKRIDELESEIDVRHQADRASPAHGR